MTSHRTWKNCFRTRKRKDARRLRKRRRMFVPMGESLEDRRLLAVGDIAIFTEIGGADSITQGSQLTHDFDNVVTNSGSAYTFTSGTDVTINEAGHHLVLYSSRFDSTGGGNRSEFNSQLNLGGVDLAYGRSSGYIRRSNGANEAFTAGGTIIEATAGQVLQLQTDRTDNNGAGAARAANNTGIQLLRLPDSLDYIRLSKSTNQTAPTGTGFVDVTYNAQDELDASSFAHNSGSGDVTLSQTSRYLVFANTYFDASGVNRAAYIQRLTLDGGEVNGSLSTVYLRGTNSTEDGTAAIGMIIDAAAGQVLNVEVAKDESNNATPTIIGTQSGLTIVRLPSTADVIRLEDSTAQNFNIGPENGAGGELLWDTQLEVGPSYSHSTTVDSSIVQVDVADDYLFFASLYDDDDQQDRQAYNQRWKVNAGTPLTYGQTGRYSRDDTAVDGDGAGDQNANGNWSGIILPGLAANDVVELNSRQMASGGALTADSNGLQGLRLTSLLEPVITTNETLQVNVNSTGNPIDMSLLETSDIDTPVANLTYTLDTVPATGTLRLSGNPLAVSDTFTQDDINNNLLTYDAGGSAAAESFDFSVSDGSAIPAMGTFNITVDVTITIDMPTEDNLTLIKDGADFVVVETGNMGNELERISGVTKLVINGNNNANTLTVDFSGGNPLPSSGVEYNGGDPALPAAPGDSLTIIGGAFTTVTHNMTAADGGNIVLDPTSGADSTITYTGLEPVSIVGGTITDVILNLPTGADNAQLSDVGSGNLRLESTDSPQTFEQATFAVPTSSLTVNGGTGDTVTVSTAISMSASLAITADTININGGTLTTTGEDQSYTGAVTLGADAILTGNDVTFNGTVASDTTSRSLAVDTSGAGVTTFTAKVGGGGNPLSSLTTNADGETHIGADVSTNGGPQTYNDPVVLIADAVLTDTGPIGISFNDTVNSDAMTRALAVNATAATSFQDSVGGSSPLASLTTDASGTTAINTTAVTTSGNQTYNDQVTLGASSVLTAANVSFSNTVGLGANDLTVDVSGTAGSAAGQISGSGGLTKDGDGNFALLVANTYTGQTTINNGRLIVADNSGLGDPSGDTVVNDGGQLRLQNNITILAGETISIRGNGEADEGALRNESGTNTITDALLFTGGGSARATSNSGTLNLPGGIQLAEDLDVHGNGTINVGGQIVGADAADDIDKNDNGTLILTDGTNSFAGPLRINNGTVRVTADGALGDVGGDTTVNNGGTLEFAGAFDYNTAEPITFSGAGEGGVGALLNSGGDTTIDAGVPLTMITDATIGSSGPVNTFVIPHVLDVGSGTLSVTGDGDTRLTGTVSDTTLFVTYPAGVSSVGGGDIDANWPFADGASPTMDTANGHDADLNGDATFTAGIVGQAIALDGNGDFLRATGYQGVTGNTPRTMAAWIKTDTSGPNLDDGGIMSWGVNTSSQKWVWRISGNRLRVETANGGVEASSVVNDGKWHHVVAVYDGSGNHNGISFYVDGNPEAITVNSGATFNTAASSDVYIGTDRVTVSNNTRDFNGQIDDATIFDRALTATEVQQLYDSAQAIPLKPAIIKNGAGELALSGDNTYHRETIINAGTLVAEHNNALGTPTSSTDQGTSVNDGGTLGLRGGSMVAEKITANGNGASGQPGAIVSLAGNNSLTGTISVAPGATEVGIGSATAGDTLTVGSAGDTINLVAAKLNLDGAGDILIPADLVQVGSPSDTVLANNPVAFYPFEGDLTDATTNNLDGAFSSGVPTFSTDTAHASSGQSLDLSGTTAYVDLGSSAALNPSGAITLSAWFNSSDTTLQFIAARDTGVDPNRAYEIHVNTDGSIAGNAWPTIGTNTNVNSNSAPGLGAGVDFYDGQWHHFAMTVDPTSSGGDGRARVYADGQLVLTATTDISDIRQLNALITTIGAQSDGSDDFNGLLDDVAIFASALSDEQISAIFAAGGSAGVTKSGMGTATLSGDNSFGGDTTVTGGRLVAAHDNALGTTDGGTTVADGATLVLDASINGNIAIPAEPLTLGSSTTGNPGTLENAVGDNSFAGAISGETGVDGEIRVLSSSAGETLTLTGDVLLNQSSLSVDGAGNTEINGAVVTNLGDTATIGEAGQIANVDGTPQTINFAATYNNPVIVAFAEQSDAGSVNLSDDPNAVEVRVFNVDPGAGTFDIKLAAPPTGSPAPAPEIVNYMVVEAGKYLLDTGAVLKADTLTVPGNADQAINFGSGVFTTTPVAVSQVMSENATGYAQTRHRAGINQNGFTLFLEEAAGMAQHAAETVGYVAIEQTDGTTAGDLFEVGVTPNSVTHNEFAVSLTNSYTSPPIFIGQQQTIDGVDPSGTRFRYVGNNVNVFTDEDRTTDNETAHADEVVGYFAFEDTTGTVEISITRDNSLLKTGAGTLKLTGDNTYDNGTTVEGGTLLVSNTTGSGTGSGDVDVNNMAVLGGTGAIGGAVTANNTSAMAPGESPETLAVGDTTWNTGTFFDVELLSDAPGNGTTGYDQLIVSGLVTIDPAADINFSLGFVPDGGDTFTIIDNDDTDSINGTFASYADDSSFMLTDMISGTMVEFSIDYQGGDGNDLVLTATGAYVINGTADNDVLEITATGEDSGSFVLTTTPPGTPGPTVAFSGATSITFNAGDGDDQLILHHPDGDFFNPDGGVLYNGQGNTAVGDSLSIDHPGVAVEADKITHSFFNDSDGSITIEDTTISDGSTVITYTGLEPITDNLDAADRVFDFLGAAETITLDAGGALDNQIDSTQGESVDFNNPSASLTIVTTSTAGGDTVNIEGVDGGFDADLTITSKAADTINFQTADTNIGSGNLTATAGSMALTANFSTSGNVDLTATTDGITDNADDNAANITANFVHLTLTTGGNLIGASAADRLEIDANILQVTAGAGGGNSVFLRDTAGGVAIRNSSVNAAANTLDLAAADGNITSETVDGTRDIGAGILILSVTGTGSIGTGTSDRLEINAVTRFDATTANGEIFVLDPDGGLPIGTITAAGDVDVLVTGGGNDITMAGTSSITATGGGVLLSAPDDIVTDLIAADTNYNGNAVKIDTPGNVVINDTITAGPGSGLNIDIDPTNATVSASLSATGDIDIAATEDVIVNSGATIEADSDNTGGGDLTITADATAAMASGSNPDDGTGDLTAADGTSLIGNNVNLEAINTSIDVVTAKSGGGNVSILTTTIAVGDALTGTNAAAITPQPAGTTIGLGGAAGTLNLDDAEIAFINGFTGATIGSATAGDIHIDTADFLVPVTVQTAGLIIDNNDTDNDIGNDATLIGEVQPGGSALQTDIALFEVDGTATLGPGTLIDYQINGLTPGDNAMSLPGGFDQIVTTSGVNLAGVQLDITMGFVPEEIDDTFVIIENLGGSVTGTFVDDMNNPIVEGQIITRDFAEFQVSYAGGVDNNDVELTYIGIAPGVFTFTDIDGVGHLMVGGTPGEDYFYFYPASPTNMSVIYRLDGGPTQQEYLDPTGLSDVQVSLKEDVDQFYGSRLDLPVNIDGGTGSNTIETGSGDDFIDASTAGADDNNKISAGDGNNEIRTGEGDDNIKSGDGDDTITAGDGDNRINSGAGDDTITALSGNDTIQTGGGSNTIDAGEGDNRITGRGDNDITTGDGNDIINASSGNDTINAGNGNNSINAGHGENMVTTGDGNDIINAYNGNDNVDAGEGNNTIRVGDGDNTVTSGDGLDRITSGNGDDEIDAAGGNNQISAGNGDNTIVVTDGNNYITSGTGMDTVTAGDGDNRIAIRDGNNIVLVGNGANNIRTGNGEDDIDVGTGANTVDAGGGNDHVMVAAGSTSPNKLLGGAGDDTLVGGDGDDNLQGGNGLDILMGLLGNDRLDGGGDDDILSGGGGDDTLIGGYGNNVLIGGVGVDSITGNNGRDILIGGSTSTEADETALAAILDEWSDMDAVPGSLGTVTDDGAIDTLYGRTGADRFWANELEDLLPDFLDPPDTLTDIS